MNVVGVGLSARVTRGELDDVGVIGREMLVLFAGKCWSYLPGKLFTVRYNRSTSIHLPSTLCQNVYI